MQKASSANRLSTIELTSEIVAAYVANNSVPVAELSSLLQRVHAALDQMSNPALAEVPKGEDLKPAVPIKKSITNDYIVCLEDGKTFKSSKRRLAVIGMTPQQYREKWNLPNAFPMVAPNYAAQRSSLAKSLGLGQNRRRHTAPEVVANLEQTSKPKRARVKQAA